MLNRNREFTRMWGLREASMCIANLSDVGAKFVNTLAFVEVEFQLYPECLLELKRCGGHKRNPVRRLVRLRKRSLEYFVFFEKKYYNKL